MKFDKENLEKASLLISLPLALLTALSIVAPPAYDVIRGNYSKLEVTLVNSGFRSIEILITNVGNKAAVLKGVYLETEGPSGPEVNLFSVPEGQRVVKPDEQLLFKGDNGYFLSASAQEFRGHTDLPEQKCVTRVDYQQFDSSKESSTYKFECFVVGLEAGVKLADAIDAGAKVPHGKNLIGIDGTTFVPDLATLEWVRGQSKVKQHEPKYAR